MPLNSRFRSAAHYQTLPREATLMEEKWTEMLTAVRNVLYEGGEVFQSKKVAYQTQLKKVQSNANAAIRNAMQVSSSGDFQSNEHKLYLKLCFCRLNAERPSLHVKS